MKSFSFRALVLVLGAMAAVVLPTGVARAQSKSLLERREVRVDGHPLSVWSKRPPTPARGAILLVHGRTWSSRPNFDLQVPGVRVSLMDAFVAKGYAVYALDQRGYGGTPRDTSGWLTPDRAERDLSAVVDWVTARESRPLRPKPPALLGYSRGALVATLVAQRHAQKLSALVLYGFPMDVTAQRVAVADPAVPSRRRTTAVAAGEDFITPQATLPGVKEAYVRTATEMDSIRADWKLEGQFFAIDPKLVRTPTLLLDGERDPYANTTAHSALFQQLGTTDKWWVVLPGVDHVAHLETQGAFVHAVVSFMERRGATAR